jgi:hypothetical protein
VFEDFENRSGFWKGLGSNFTINYAGSKPSFLSSGEMWQSMDGSNTQTLAAWENGWVLTNNPDGSMTANPKYTSGLPSETIVRVPVGPTNLQNPPSGVVVTGYGAETKTFASFVGSAISAHEKATTTEDENEDTNDCASEHRAVNDDDTCGDCITGYSEDTNGDCIVEEEEEEEEEEGTNWLLYGGIAAVAVFALMG